MTQKKVWPSLCFPTPCEKCVVARGPDVEPSYCSSATHTCCIQKRRRRRSSQWLTAASPDIRVDRGHIHRNQAAEVKWIDKSFNNFSPDTHLSQLHSDLILTFIFQSQRTGTFRLHFTVSVSSTTVCFTPPFLVYTLHLVLHDRSCFNGASTPTVCDYCSTGDLYTYWQMIGQFTEDTVRVFAAELGCALGVYRY